MSKGTLMEILARDWSTVVSLFLNSALGYFNHVEQEHFKKKGGKVFRLPQEIGDDLGLIWYAAVVKIFIYDKVDFVSITEVEKKFSTKLEEHRSKILEGEPSGVVMAYHGELREYKNKKYWKDFFHGRYWQQLVKSLGSIMQEVMDMQEVKKGFDKLLWPNWKREEVEQRYRQATQNFSEDLATLRKNMFGLKSPDGDQGHDQSSRASIDDWWGCTKELAVAPFKWVLSTLFLPFIGLKIGLKYLRGIVFKKKQNEEVKRLAGKIIENALARLVFIAVMALLKWFVLFKEKIVVFFKWLWQLW